MKKKEKKNLNSPLSPSPLESISMFGHVGVLTRSNPWQRARVMTGLMMRHELLTSATQHGFCFQRACRGRSNLTCSACCQPPCYVPATRDKGKASSYFSSLSPVFFFFSFSSFHQLLLSGENAWHGPLSHRLPLLSSPRKCLLL